MLAYVVDLTVRYIIVSSAKSQTLLLTESGRSFIYARKRHGANTDPWGTPDTTDTVLGSCLFLHYINDVPEGIGSTVRLFADDTVMYLTIASQTDSHKLQTDLNNLAKWEKKWQMQFHPDKCQVLRITNKRKPIIFNYTLHDHILATVTQAKYLGVTITNDLNWKQHVENIIKSANKALGFLRRNLRINSVKAKEQAYLTYDRPILEYSCTV